MHDSDSDSDHTATGGQWPTTPNLDVLVSTRLALHRLASTVIAPTRYRATGRFGLIATPGGFGTPRFGSGDEPASGDTGRQIRVAGTQLIDDVDGSVRSTPITTLQAAASFLDAVVDPETAVEHDSPAVGDVDERLDVDEQASDFLGAWYAMAFGGLTATAGSTAAVDPSTPQLWPGHFDPAIESGTEATRASYGASPGDEATPEPYLYVALWYPEKAGVDTDDSFWNATAFTGRTLRLSDFSLSDRPTVDEATAIAERFWVEVAERVS